jgi:hypothetical protein
MTDALEIAQKFDSDFNLAQANLNGFLLPFLRQYADLLVELNPNYEPRDLNTAEMLYKETGSASFHFEGEEEYSYGDYYTPSLSLPFEFLKDPEGYSDKARKRVSETASRREQAKKAKDLARVVALEDMLSRAKKEAGL